MLHQWRVVKVGDPPDRTANAHRPSRRPMQGRGPGITRLIHPEPPGPVPEDPEELVACILDAERRGELYHLYAALRSLAPVHATASAALPEGCHVLTSHRAVDRVARSAAAVNDPATAEVFKHGGAGGAFYRMMANAMLFLDKPAHDRVRRLVWKAFTPRAVAPLRALTEQVAHELIDAVEPDGAMDFVEGYAYPLPIRVISRLLGLGGDDRVVVEQWAWDFARAGDPMSATPEIVERGDRAAEAFHAFFERILAERRRRPGDDLLSALAVAEDGGDRLSVEEAVATSVLLVQAGHETTADLLGNALVALFRHPDQLARLREDPSVTADAVEELLRYDTVVQMSMRLLVDDLDVDGVRLPAGGFAALVYGAANRDPEVFPDPDRLDLARRPSHLSFSAGAYHCLGHALARTELQGALRVLCDRRPTIRPAGPTFEQRRTARLRGPQALPVAWG
jgi:cytochrome P450